MYGNDYWNEHIVGVRDGSGYNNLYNVQMNNGAHEFKKGDIMLMEITRDSTVN